MKTNKFICEKCGGEQYKPKISSLEFDIGEKKVVVGRVSVKECQKCHHPHLTPAGTAKVNRCLEATAMLLGGINL